MTWHVIGKNSYIAQRLLKRIQGKSEVLCYSRQGGSDTVGLDLAVPKTEDVKYVKPGDYVVLLAAVSAPDECEKHYRDSYMVNVTGTETLIKRCIAQGANVLFFSSDLVLGKTVEAVDEYGDVEPVGNYGAMKQMVEEMFSDSRQVKTFRLSYVFSSQDKFFRYLLECQKNGKIAEVFDALYRNVVYVEDVIDAIISLSESFPSWDNSIFHVCGEELLSRKNLAELYQSKIAPDFKFKVSMPERRFFATRPNVIKMKSLYFGSLIGRRPTSFEKALWQEFGKNKGV